MHETSLVRSLLAQVEAVLRDHPGALVEAIRVEAGPLSGVEPLLIRSAFERIVEETACRGAVLCIEEVDLSARCDGCGRTFVVEQFRFACPFCLSARINILSGDEFRLLDVTLAADENGPDAAVRELAGCVSDHRGAS